MLGLDEYQKHAKTFDVTPDLFKMIIERLLEHGATVDVEAEKDTDIKIGRFLRLNYYLHGLSGEVGEISNKFKKIQRDSDGIMSEKMREDFADELGDVMWYMSRLADLLGFSLGDICQGNLSKLADRKERGVLKGSGDNR